MKREDIKTPTCDKVMQPEFQHEPWLVPLGVARELERDRRELIEALRELVAIDDGDQPSLWKFTPQFEVARALLDRLTK